MTRETKAHLWGVANTLAILALIAIASYYVFFERPWLSYPNPVFPVLDPAVNAGNPVRLAVERCNSQADRRVYNTARQIEAVDDSKDPIMLPGTTVSIAPGCHKTISAINIIPLGTSPGRYQVAGFAQVEGTVRTTIVPWKSQPFDVVP